MFDWLGTFKGQTQFGPFAQFLETVEGAQPNIPDRIKHLGVEDGRLGVFEGYMRAIDSRRAAGTQLRWKEEPTIPTTRIVSPPRRDDAEASLFVVAMKRVWVRLFWHKKDTAAYDYLKIKDRRWCVQDEIRDVAEHKSRWAAWKQKVLLMVNEASMDRKIYRCLLHTNDDPNPGY